MTSGHDSAEKLAAFAANVRAKVARAGGINRSKFAERLRIDQAAVSRRFSGTTPWKAHELVLLAEFTGAPLSALYGEEPASAGGAS